MDGDDQSNAELAEQLERIAETLSDLDERLARIESQLELSPPPGSEGDRGEDGTVGGHEGSTPNQPPPEASSTPHEEPDESERPRREGVALQSGEKPRDPSTDQRATDGATSSPRATDGATSSQRATSSDESAPGEQPPPSSEERTARQPDGDEQTRESSSGGPSIVGVLNVFGIGLVLLGIGFLYKLGLDNNIIAEAWNVGVGALIGGGLGGAGWRIRRERYALAQILMGGASAAFFISVYAAYAYYDLLPHPVAFACMTAVTTATFVVAVDQRTVSLALVGAIGGFLTPFVLAGETDSVLGVSLYNAVLVVGMQAIYAVRGWRSLFAVTAIGGWIVVAISAFAAEPLGSTRLEAASVQLQVIAVWVAVGIIPTLRLLLLEDRPEIRRTLQSPDADEDLISSSHALLVHTFLLLSPFFGLGASRVLWDLPSSAWDFTAIVVAAAYLGASSRLAESDAVRLDGTAWLTAIGLATLAFGELFSFENWPVVFALEGLGLAWAARERRDDTLLRVLSHIFVIGGGLVLGGFHALATDAGSPQAIPFLNPDGLRIAVLIAVTVGISYVDESDTLSIGYRYIAHVWILIFFLYRQAHLAPEGQLLATASWGIYALGLLIWGLAKGSRQVEYVGFGTIVLSVAKLILVDMAGADTIWRVLLFIIFGIALLAVSYLTPSLRADSDAQKETQGD